MVMPFSVLLSVFGMGVALMGLQIRLSGQVRDQIRTLSTGVHGDIQDLNGRIELMEERLSREIRGLRTCINGPVDIDRLSGEIKEVRGEVAFIKGHLSAVLALGVSKKVETP